MPLIKKYSPYQNLSNFKTFILDTNINSTYFAITEFTETFTGGKNGFLIAGTPYLKGGTELKIEVLDVNGNPIYYEPGDGIPEYYEGTSKLISIHVYPDTPIGLGTVTILGELSSYIDEDGIERKIPNQWAGIYNVKWQRSIDINRNIANETIVRFVKRPKITITELAKPIFSKTIPFVSQSGILSGFPIIPTENTELKNWTAGTLYQLSIQDDTRWTASITDNQIFIPELDYTTTVREVVNSTTVLVDIPYIDTTNRVKGFSNKEYTASFEYLEGQTITETALTGSFAKIDITNLKTFVGDVARLKIFRKSKSDIGDFSLVQETKLESVELLRDTNIVSDTEIGYGNFTEETFANYWITSSLDHPITLNVDKLAQSLKIEYNESSTETQKIITSQSITINPDVEYSLNFKTILDSRDVADKYIKVYLSGSDYFQNVLELKPTLEFTNRQIISQNFISSNETQKDCKLIFEFKGKDWYISNISLRNSQDTSFSPDSFTLIQEIPRKLDRETFDFRFEFYDINNNYIPVDVRATYTFTGGNSNTSATNRFLNLDVNRTSFFFNETTNKPEPETQTANFIITQNGLVGDVSFTSAAFDDNGVQLTDGDYIGGQYPGLLTDISNAGATLSVGNFTGSRNDIKVSSISYTATQDGLSSSQFIFRVSNGLNGQNPPPNTLVKVEADESGVGLWENPSGISPAGPIDFTQLVIGSNKYALWTDAITPLLSSPITDVSGEIEWNSIGYLGFAGDVVANNKFATKMNKYLSNVAEVGDFVVIYIDNNNYGVYSITDNQVYPIYNFQKSAGYSATIKMEFEWGAGVFGPYPSATLAKPKYIGFARGIVSAGLVFRGSFNSSEIYYYTDTRRDIVLGSDSAYYLANNTEKSGLSGWDNPVSITNDWVVFDGVYTAIATDFLFAQDVYANRTINIGSDGVNPVIALNADWPTYENPFISIGATAFDELGIFLGFDGGIPKFSLVSNTGNYLKWDGDNLYISGQINGGSLGGWVVDDKVLRDENSIIKLNPITPAIEIYDDLSNKKVDIRRGNLSNPTSGTSILIDPPNSSTFSSTVYSPISWFPTGKIYSSTYETITITESALYSSPSPTWGAGVGNIAQTSNNYSGATRLVLRVNIHSSITPTDANLVSTQIIGNTDWIYNPSQLYSLFISASYTSFNLSAGTYYIFTVWETQGTISTGTITLNGSKNPSPTTFSSQLSQIEITDKGLMIVQDAGKYIKAEINTGNPILQIYQNDTSLSNSALYLENTAANGTALIVNGGDSLFRDNVIFYENIEFSPGSAYAISMGDDAGQSVLIGRNWPAGALANVNNARLRSATRLGITGHELARDTSTIRIKKDIEDFPKDTAYESIKKIKPILFWPKDKIDGTGYEDYNAAYLNIEKPKEYIGKQGGFIAEWLDSDSSLRSFVSYDEDGKPISITYDRLTVPIVAAMQKLMEKVELLETEIAELKSQFSGSYNK
jgi:hypothetical protein